MNAPAMPPPAAPMRARSRTVRFFIKVWAFGAGLEVGRIHFGLWVGYVAVVVEAKGRRWLFWGLGFVEERVRVVVVKWLRIFGKSVRDEGSWWGLGEGRPREDEILASMEGE